MAVNKKVRDYTNIADMLESAYREVPEKPAFRYKTRDDEIVEVSYAALYRKVENLGAALLERGFGNAHIACVGENSYDYVCAYLAVIKGAGVFCPVDRELPEDELVYVLNNSESRFVFCSRALEAKLRAVRDKLTYAEAFAVFGRSEDDGEFLSFSKLVEEGKRLSHAAYDAQHSEPDELKLLVYTSGTTGSAKGVMLTEHNLISMVNYGLRLAKLYDVGMSVLPYHHTYEGVAGLLGALGNRSCVCINDSIKNTIKNMQIFKPEYVYLVPAFAEAFYTNIMKNLKKTGRDKKFSRALAASEALRKVGIDQRRRIFAELHELFGGRLKKIVCGGAPIRPEIGEFFDKIGIMLTGGYGITECSPIVSGNNEGSNKFNTAGQLLGCVEVKIDEPDEDGIGEICVKGDTVMKGYYKNPEKTAEVMRDGWFCTGDYGFLTKKKELVITGRKKNLIVLNNGKNIYPEEIEGYIMRVPYIDEVVVRGIKNEHGQEIGLSAEIYMEKPREDIVAILRDVQAALSSLPSYKTVSKIVVRETPFDKTTTNKVKR